MSEDAPFTNVGLEFTGPMYIRSKSEKLVVHENNRDGEMSIRITKELPRKNNESKVAEVTILLLLMNGGLKLICLNLLD